MSRETNVRIKFTVTDSQLKKMFSQLRRLETRIRSMSKQFTKLGNNFKRLNSILGTSSTKIKKADKSLKGLSNSGKKAITSSNKLGGSMKKTGNNMKRTTDSSKKLGKSLGFTGLAFGLIGGVAGFAGSQIRDKFTSAVEEAVSVLGEINRISLFSDTGFIDGLNINPSGFEDAFTLSVASANKYGLVLEEIPTLLKEIEKAAPSSVDINPFREAILGLKVLENEVSTSQLAADFSTVFANFPEKDAEEIFDLLFAFSRETKLSFGAGSKAIAFAAQSAKLLNTPLEELLANMVNIVAAVPGERGNAGRSIRAFIGNFTDLESLAKFEKFDIEIFDPDTKKFLGLDKVLTGFTEKVKQFEREGGDIKKIAFLEEFGLDKNAFTGLLSFVNASDEAKQAARDVFKQENIKGTAFAAVEDQAGRVEASFNRLKNIATLAKLEFTRGLAPALKELSEIFGTLFADKEFLTVIRQFGTAVGDALSGISRVLIPTLSAMSGLLKDNEPLVRLLAGAFVVLTAALTGMGVIFPLLGGMFAMIFVHEQLVKRGTATATNTNIMARAYVRLADALGSIKTRFVKFITDLRRGTFTMKKLNAQIVLMKLRLKALSLQLKIAALQFRIFSRTAVVSLLAVGRAWLVALGPIIIAAAAFLAFLILLKVFQKEVTAFTDSLDETGTRSQRLFENIDALFSLLGGDIDPAIAAVNRDLADLEIQAQTFQDAWDTLLQDLENSKAWKFVTDAIADVDQWFKDVQATWDGFVASLTFSLDESWQILTDTLAGVWQWFTDLLQPLNDWLEAAGFDLDPVWEFFAVILGTIWQALTVLLSPLSNFIEALDFEIPSPLELVAGLIKGIEDAWTNLVTAVNENPLGAAIIELFGILGNFGDNLDKGIKDNPIGTPREPVTPFIDPEEGDAGFIGPIQDLFNFGGGEQIGALLDLQVPLLEEENTALTAHNSNLSDTNEILAASVELGEENNDFVDTGNTLRVVDNRQSAGHNDLLNFNNALVDAHNQLLILLIDKLEIQILEVTRNINSISALTSIVAASMLMFANLIAQGNRAAGKLASLRVSSSGKFSISDPGVSEFDQKNIDAASENLIDTIANQIVFDVDALKGVLEKITQPVQNFEGGNTNNVQINNVFNVSEFENLDDESIVTKIRDMLEEELEATILSV